MSSNDIVLDVIILILEIVCGTLGEGIVKVPMRVESLISPIPMSSYGIIDFLTRWILSVEVGSEEK